MSARISEPAARTYAPLAGHLRSEPAARTPLQEIRENIDRIDGRLVALLAERGRFVREAARFTRDVRAPARAARVLANVRRLARRHAIDPAIAERVWRALIGAFIRFELAEHSRLRSRLCRRARRGGS